MSARTQTTVRSVKRNMSEYVNKQWMLEEYKMQKSKGVIAPLDMIENAPTIKIVRCLECIHAEADLYGNWSCIRGGVAIRTRAWGFCDGGEKDEQVN